MAWTHRRKEQNDRTDGRSAAAPDEGRRPHRDPTIDSRLLSAAAMHMTPEQLVDVTEGAAERESFPHLSTCAVCQLRLTELRQMISTLDCPDAARVPEPPTFFWIEFQHGVSERVRSSGPHCWSARARMVRAAVGSWLGTRAGLISAAAAVALVLFAVRLNMPSVGRRPTVAPSSEISSPATGGTVADTRLGLWSDATLDDDPSLQLVAALTTGLDADAVEDAGLVPAGSAEHAITHMSDDELRELRRLLQQELGS